MSDDVRSKMLRDLLTLYRSKPQYIDVVKRVLEVWSKYVSEFRCPKCGSKNVEIKAPYYKCRSCGTIDTMIGVETNKFSVYPAHLHKLVYIGALMITYKSRRYTHYAVRDPEILKDSIRMFEEERRELGIHEPLKIPGDLFSDVVGLDDVKSTIIRVLKSKKPLHILLVGSPASAKSMMMEEIWKKVRGTYLVLAGTATKAGLRDIIADYTPRILMIDEIDKCTNSNDLSVLLSWMESQRIVIAMHGRYETVECPYPDGCKVIAACNNELKLPRELRSRFIVKRIKEYSREDVVKICVHKLTKHEGVSKNIAEYIGRSVVEKLHSRDPRDCIKVARLIEKPTREEVDKVIKDLTT